MSIHIEHPPKPEKEQNYDALVRAYDRINDRCIARLKPEEWESFHPIVRAREMVPAWVLKLEAMEEGLADTDLPRHEYQIRIEKFVDGWTKTIDYVLTKLNAVRA